MFTNTIARPPVYAAIVNWDIRHGIANSPSRSEVPFLVDARKGVASNPISDV